MGKTDPKKSATIDDTNTDRSLAMSIAETAITKHSRIEISLLVAVLAFVVGLAFDAGMVWNRQVNMRQVQNKHGSQIDALRQAVQSNRTDTQVRLSRIETLLTEMHRSQIDIKNKLEASQ